MRQITFGTVVAASCVAFLTGAAEGSVALLTQDRSITAITTANAGTQTAAAADFGPFIQVVQLSTTFGTPGGGVAVNSARSEINCVTDPNAIRASGALAGQGGTNAGGADELGEAQVNLYVTFSVSEPTPFQLLANPRQSSNPQDGFEVELTNLTTDTDLFAISELDAPQSVNFSGVLQPGTYAVRYKNELTVAGAEQLANFNFEFLVPAPGSLGLAGGFAAWALRRRRRA
jgi:hypothetical protein